MTDADVIICFFCTAQAALPAFTRPTRVIQMPTPSGQKYKAQIDALGTSPLRAIIAKYAPDVHPLRVAALGFSEGCQGVRALLSSPDGGRLDAAVAIDGIHAQYAPSNPKALVPAYVTPWGAMASRAVQGRTLLAITTSAIRPPGFASTTETAAWIWKYATGQTTDTSDAAIPAALLDPFNPPVVYKAGTSGTLKWPTTTYAEPPVDRYRRDRGLAIVNYRDLDSTGHNDHIFQAQHVLPVVLSSFLATRWNTIGPTDGICVLASPIAVDDAQGNGCFPPSALTDLYLNGEGDARPLDIPSDAEVDPTIPDITGAPTTTAAAPPSSSVATFLKWTAGLLGATLVVTMGQKVGSALFERGDEHKKRGS